MLLDNKDWNPAVASLGQVASDLLERPDNESAQRTSKDLTNALQTTAALLSKLIQQLAEQDNATAAWSSFRTLQEKLSEIVEVARSAMQTEQS